MSGVNKKRATRKRNGKKVIIDDDGELVFDDDSTTSGSTPEKRKFDEDVPDLSDTDDYVTLEQKLAKITKQSDMKNEQRCKELEQKIEKDLRPKTNPLGAHKACYVSLPEVEENREILRKLQNSLQKKANSVLDNVFGPVSVYDLSADSDIEEESTVNSP